MHNTTQYFGNGWFLMMHIVDMTSSAPTVTHVIPGDKEVTGVASLGDDVFVVRAESPQVEVYSAETFTLQRRLPVPELGCSFGLTVCATSVFMRLTATTTAYTEWICQAAMQ